MISSLVEFLAGTEGRNGLAGLTPFCRSRCASLSMPKKVRHTKLLEVATCQGPCYYYAITLVCASLHTR